MFKKPLRILIVEDSELLCQRLEEFLSVFKELQVVGLAANGQEALKGCFELRPDVVLMDVIMPLMDGLTAARIIRQKYPRIQVVFLSSIPQWQIPNALATGAYAYLEKAAISIEMIAETLKAAPLPA